MAVKWVGQLVIDSVAKKDWKKAVNLVDSKGLHLAVMKATLTAEMLADK